MKKITAVCLFTLALLSTMLWSLTFTPGASAGYGDPPPDEEIVPINGTGSWAANQPTRPDFEGVNRIPFQAANPTRETWISTQKDNLRFLDPTGIPENIQVSSSGVVSGASNLVNDFSEVMVAIDPTNPDHLIGGSKFFYFPPGYDFFTGVFESYDGGLTWDQEQPAGVEFYDLTSDPVSTFDELGNGYFTLLTRGPGLSGLDMLKKPAGANHWEPPVTVDTTTLTDKQWIIGDQDPQSLSPHAGNIYMSWTSFGGPATGIVFSRSTDRNQTWSAPFSISGGSVQGSIPGIAPDGTVYVLFGRNVFGGPGTLEIAKSSNGGASFGSPTIAANISSIPNEFPQNFPGPTPPNFRTPASLPAFVVSPVDGNLYTAWADYRNGDSDIYFSRSTDGGLNWDPQIRLNDDPIGNGIDQWQPQVSVAPNGRVAVMWFDRRLDCPNLPWINPSHVGVSNACIDTFMTRSFDEGQTWVPNIRASEQTWDWTINLPITSGGQGFIGDYQGIASSNDYDFPFWNATADLGENPDRYQQIFIARVPVVDLPDIDLSASSKEASSPSAQPGDVLTYTITISNTGADDATSVLVTDSIPISTSYVSNSLVFSSGAGSYLSATNTITWTGGVSAGLSAMISFEVTLSESLLPGAVVTNTVEIDDGIGGLFARIVEVEIPILHLYLPLMNR